jgi:hypothetical protein
MSFLVDMGLVLTPYAASHHAFMGLTLTPFLSNFPGTLMPFFIISPGNVQVYHIRNERQVLGTVDSEWVVKLLYSFQDDRYVYLAMVCLK